MLMVTTRVPVVGAMLAAPIAAGFSCIPLAITWSCCASYWKLTPPGAAFAAGDLGRAVWECADAAVMAPRATERIFRVCRISDLQENSIYLRPKRYGRITDCHKPTKSSNSMGVIRSQPRESPERGAHPVCPPSPGSEGVCPRIEMRIPTKNMSRKALIAANWKMYKTPAQAKAFVDAFLPLVAGHHRDEIVLFPSPVLLPAVIAACSGSNVAVGAQNIHFAEEGAYTGETSIGQLKAVGGTHTLIGHSERRQYFAETDEIVNKKLHTALKHGIVPIVCIGEVLAERESGKTGSVLKSQVEGAFAGVTSEAAAPIVIAYEPVWAIGTGKTATPEIAEDAHKIIRAEVA